MYPSKNKPPGSQGALLGISSQAGVSWIPMGLWAAESPCGCAAWVCHVEAQAARTAGPAPQVACTGVESRHGEVSLVGVPLPGAAPPSALKAWAAFSA